MHVSELIGWIIIYDTIGEIDLTWEKKICILFDRKEENAEVAQFLSFSYAITLYRSKVLRAISAADKSTYRNRECSHVRK